MVICNIVYGSNLNESDFETLEKLGKCPVINVTSDITFLDTDVPTIFYGYKTAIKNCGEFDRQYHKINEKYWWTYCNREIAQENWILAFVKKCEKDWFLYVDSGIDVVFDKFNLDDFTEKLSPYPLIHEGEYEIYVADFGDPIQIFSIKKDTLEYAGINAKDFLNYMYLKLGYNFVTIESRKHDLVNCKTKPIFLDDLLLSIYGKMMEVKDVVDLFRNDLSLFKIDRSKVVFYYLKTTKHLRSDFILLK